MLRSLLLAIVVLLLALAPAAHAEVSAEARGLFRDGVKLLKDPAGPDYATAYAKFREAYRLSESPKVLSNLALCAKELERDGEAIDAYQTYLKKVRDIRPVERRAIQKDLRLLRRRVAYLTLELEPAAARIVDVRDGVENVYEADGGSITIGVRAGKHELSIEREGHTSESLELQLKAGSKTTERVQLEAIPESPAEPEPESGFEAPVVDEPQDDDGGELSAGLWVGLAATGALGIGTAVTGGLVLSNKSEFDDAFAQGDIPRARELRDDGTTLATVTDVLLGTTAAAAAATVVILIVDVTADGSDGDEGEPLEARWYLAPTIAPNRLGASFAAEF